ncbi:hypothetical protein K7X08_012812 [Anisodus acutangulus]|uniref:Uncharacterized protein n=1 Tax=Anisodus acutangulus TaxID=402998 RepID=A0A9Q1MAP5_9SOLA|nr:hypothetical protein K7X08_012812 [Anisodus acutangulus]
MFKGYDLVEQQNDHFSASMVNRITWETVGSQPFLDVDVKLNISLENDASFSGQCFCNNCFRIMTTGFDNIRILCRDS